MKTIIVDSSLRGILGWEDPLMNSSGSRTLWAASASELIERHRVEPADLVVTGLNPPGMTAESLCRAIRQDEGTKRVSIIVVGSGTLGEQARLRACRANHYFIPPLDHGEFAATVRQLVSIAARQKYGVLVSVDVEGTLKGVPFFAKSENISISGILFVTSRILQSGDVADLAFFLPAFGRITLETEVVRTEPRDGKDIGYGARFIGVSPMARAAIGAFVESRLSRRPEGPKRD